MTDGIVESGGARLGDAATYAAAILIAAFFATPFIWLVSLALRTPAEVFLGAARLIPEAPTLANFRQILSDSAFSIYLWNGVKLSALGAALGVALAIPGAYACSRLRFRAKPWAMIGILAVQMVSPLVILIPLYRYMDRLGLLETDLSVVAVYAALGVPLSVWLLKTSFDAIPIELEEAAALDGCTRLGVLRWITLPLAAPGIAAAFILTMIMNWSQFLVPFILLTDADAWPISVAIFNFAGSSSASTTQLLAAACLVAVVPAVAIFAILQRLIMRALIDGAVKG